LKRNGGRPWGPIFGADTGFSLVTRFGAALGGAVTMVKFAIPALAAAALHAPATGLAA
jgi:hypothetical protein